MDNKAVSIGGDVSQSVVVTGNGTTVSLRFGDSGVILALSRKHARRRRRAARELDLLVAEHSALPFIGRQDMLTALQGWAESDADVSVHALTGRAGSGKTRLALALCKALESTGAWRAGFLTGADLAAAMDALATRAFDWSQAPRLLVVLDDAAQFHQALSRWMDRLADESFGKARLRILLLEREAPAQFGWWHDLASDPYRRGLLHRDRPVVLPGLADVEERRHIMRAAHSAAKALRNGIATDAIPAPGDNPRVDRALAEPQFGNPLNLVMAGVLAVDQGAVAALALRRLDAARRLAGRELERFGRLAKAAGVDSNAMRHAIGFNGLTGGLPMGSLLDALATELEAARLGAQTTPTLTTLLEQELPPRLDAEVKQGDRRLGAIKPDLIGEAVIVAAFSGEGWREAEGPKALARAYAIHPEWSAATLMRLLQDFAYAAEDPAASGEERETATRLLGWLDVLVDNVSDPFALAPIADAFPPHSLVLREAAVKVQWRVAEALRLRAEQTGMDNDAAAASGALNNLANRLSHLGQREAALAAAQESVDLRRVLAAARPDAFTPNLATSLNNLANRLSDLGQREAALAAAQKAADLYRSLAATRPDAFTPDLATSLNNLANRLSDLGQREAALAAAQEAVDLRRTLAAARPDAFTPDLAMSLTNLANGLGELGQREAALAAAQEAVDLYRILAAARPDAFTPNLAASLNNLANRLSDLGQREAALAAGQEAVDLHRNLAAARPDAFTPDLAMSLTNLAAMLSDLGQREAALAAAQEAVDLYRVLAAARPDAFTPDLAGSLNNLAAMLSDLGQREAALAAVQEAVDRRRVLAAARPDVFTPVLANSLWMLGDLLAENGQFHPAVATLAEGVRALTPYALAHPAAFGGRMTGIVRSYGKRCAEAGVEPDSGLLEPLLPLFEDGHEE